jgi:Spy/CpxP family protein refolding chaperone
MTHRTIVASTLSVLLSLASVAAQDPPPPPAQGAPGGQRKANQPVVGPNAARGLGPLEIQDQMDGYALVQGQTVLQLTDEQTPNFVARYVTLQRLRRRYNQERNRMMREMRPLLQNAGAGNEEALVERLKALDDLNVRSVDEIRKAHTNLDAVLNPVQRARFRFFEEELERKKIELLGLVNQGRGRGVAPDARKGGGH